MLYRLRVLKLAALTLSMLLGFMFVSELSAENSIFRDDNLQPGPYPVGFKTIEKFDYSRTLQSDKDYFGEPLDVETARPIQVGIWYPAAESLPGEEVVYGVYVYSYPEDERFINSLAALQNRHIRHLYQLTNDQVLLQDIMSYSFEAFSNPKPVDSAFPLIIYHPAWNGNMVDNAVLCEYLASHGYIVATTSSFGPTGTETEIDQAYLETLTRDKEFILTAVRELPNVDISRTGLLGYEAGGLTSLFMAMRNTDIDAVASLITNYIPNEYADMIFSFPSFKKNRLAIPLLQLYAPLDEMPHKVLSDSLPYADQYLYEFKNFDRLDFALYGMITALAAGTPDSVLAARKKKYAAMCPYVLNFFDAKLKDNPKAEETLARAVTDKQVSDLYTPEKVIKTGRDLPPTREQFYSIIRQKGLDTALALYKQFIAEDSTLELFREADFNVLGYQYLQTGRAENAVKVFKINAEKFPNSANCWDSYADGCLGMGDTTTAVTCYKKVLELVGKNPDPNSDLMQTIKTNAENFLSSYEANKE